MVKGKGLGQYYAIIAAGYIPTGLAFGAFAESLHLGSLIPLTLSLTIYSGAAQSAFLGFVPLGLPILPLAVTAFLLNLRHTFYGPHLSSQRSERSVRDILLIGPFLTDEVYAVSLMNPKLGFRQIAPLALFAYFLWALSSFLGSILSQFATAAILTAIAVSLPALFVSLLVPRLKSATTVQAMITAVALSVIFRFADLGSYFIIIAILAGVGSGILMGSLRRRADPSRNSI